MGILNKIITAFKGKPDDTTGLEQDASTPSFLQGEAEYRYQSVKRERYAFKEKVRPGIIADLLLDNNVSEHITGMVVCITSTNPNRTKKPQFYDDYRIISEFDILSFLLHEDTEGNLRPVYDGNLTVILYRDEGLPIVMTFKVLYDCNDIVYIRVFSLLSGTNDADDKRVSQGNNLPILKSTMLSCCISYADISERMKFYEMIERETGMLVQADKQITNKFHQSLYEGANCRKDLIDYLQIGDQFLNHNRYYDSYRQYARVLKSLDKPALNVQYGNRYWEIAYGMSKSLMGIGDYARAFHYIEVARSYNTRLIAERLFAMAKLSDYRVLPEMSQQGGRLDENVIQKIEDAYYDSKKRLKDDVDADMTYISIGFVLQHLLRASKYNVFSMMVCHNKEGHFSSEFISDRERLWNMKLEDVLQDNNTLIIPYSRNYKECRIETDKSELYCDGCIIMQVSRITATDLARVDIMMPAFAGDNDKMNSLGDFIPEGTSFIIGMHPVEYDYSLRNEDLMAHANQLCSSFRVLEALHGFLHVFNDITARYYDSNEDEQRLCNVVAGRIGFCYNEQNMGDVAEYYLSIGINSHNVEDLTEYVNCLVNMKDIRAMSIIDNLLLQHIETDDNTARFFHAFLKRRKAYVLIDWGIMSKAKEFLEIIQGDPLCKDYATKELLWIEQQEKDNQ